MNFGTEIQIAKHVSRKINSTLDSSRTGSLYDGHHLNESGETNDIDAINRLMISNQQPSIARQYEILHRLNWSDHSSPN